MATEPQKSTTTEIPATPQEIASVHQLRTDIEMVIARAKGLPSRKERNIGITELKDALMWFGRDLERMGEKGVIIQVPPYK